METDATRCFRPALLFTFRRLQPVFTSLRECTEMNYRGILRINDGKDERKPKTDQDWKRTDPDKGSGF